MSGNSQDLLHNEIAKLANLMFVEYGICLSEVNIDWRHARHIGGDVFLHIDKIDMRTTSIPKLRETNK